MKEELFKLLLNQLDWPVLMTKVWASKKLIELLDGDKNYELRPMFLNWLSGQTNEAGCVAGLAILSSIGKEIFSLFELRKAIKYPSILTDMYLENIYGPIRFITWENQHSGHAPMGFVPGDLFLERSTQYVAPMFSHGLLRLDHHHETSLRAQWAWEYEKLMEIDGHYSPSPDYFLDHTNRGNSAGFFCLRESNLLYSAYLRVFSYAVSELGMPMSLARFHVLFCAPICPKFIKIEPHKKLDFWPVKIEANPSAEECKSMLESIFSQQKDSDEILVAAIAGINREENTAADLEIGAFFTPQNYNKSAKEVFNSSFHAYGAIWENDFIMGNKLPADTVENVTKPWIKAEALPVFSKIFPLHTPRWQVDWLTNMILWPAPYLFGEVTASYTSEGCIFKNDSRDIGRFILWHDQWEPQHLKNISTGVGKALFIKKTALTAVLNSDLRAYGCLTTLNRERSYGDYKSTTITESIKLNLISTNVRV